MNETYSNYQVPVPDATGTEAVPCVPAYRQGTQGTPIKIFQQQIIQKTHKKRQSEQIVGKNARNGYWKKERPSTYLLVFIYQLPGTFYRF